MAATLIAVVWLSVTVYAVLGGADFGAGALDMFASARGADREREAIAKAIAPVWEANHVWLIFALTGLLSAFPRAFGALGMVVFVPATLALAGVVVRGAALAFAVHIAERSRSREWLRRLFGAASVMTPLIFGTTAGGLARERLEGGGASTSWFGPFQLLVGVFAVALCCALAASFLTVEAQRAGARDLVATFRTRGLHALGAAGGLAAIAFVAAAPAAPSLFAGLTHRALPVVLLAGGAFCAGFAALGLRRFRLGRAAVVLGTAAVVWGWGLAQYPRLIGSGLTVNDAAASPPELRAVSVALVGGFVLLVPSLWLLYAAFRRRPIEVTK